MVQFLFCQNFLLFIERNFCFQFFSNQRILCFSFGFSFRWKAAASILLWSVNATSVVAPTPSLKINMNAQLILQYGMSLASTG